MSHECIFVFDDPVLSFWYSFLKLKALPLTDALEIIYQSLRFCRSLRHVASHFSVKARDTKKQNKTNKNNLRAHGKSPENVRDQS